MEDLAEVVKIKVNSIYFIYFIVNIYYYYYRSREMNMLELYVKKMGKCCYRGNLKISIFTHFGHK